MRSLAAPLSLLLLLGLASCGGQEGGSGTASTEPPECSADFRRPNYADATDPSTGRANLLVWWDDFPVRVAVAGERALDIGGGETASASTLTEQSAQKWTDATGGDVSFTFVPAAATREITVTFADIPARPGASDALAVTRSTYSPASRQLVSAEITVNIWPGMTRSEILNGLKATIGHEFGHALFVLGHSPQTDDLMTPALDPRLDRDPTLRDVNTLATAYCGVFSRATRSRPDDLKTVEIICTENHIPGRQVSHSHE